MGKINFLPGEETVLRDFKEGNSVQVRVRINPGEEKDYEKGRTVTVEHDGTESTGRIVSDPLVVTPKKEGGEKELSLIIEKTESK